MAVRKCVGGFEFASKLVEAGIIPEAASRVVIDIACDDVVKVYYETVADKELLDVTIEALLKYKDRIRVADCVGLEAKQNEP